MLTEKDLESLRRSFLTPEIINAAKIERVDDEGGAKSIGRSPSARMRYAGLVFPYFLPPDNSRPRQFRLRPDFPEKETNKHGVVKEKGKYLGASGQPPLLYFPPGLDIEILNDPETPIVLTEGEKKTLALHRLSTISGTLDFLALGLSGVWNFRTRIAGDGEDNQATSRVIADFDLINWSGRNVTIVFDANVRTNGLVEKAREALAEELNYRGAVIKLVDLPVSNSINGVDDLLGTWESQRGLEVAISNGQDLLRRATPWLPRGRESNSQQDRLLRQLSKLTIFRTPEKGVFVDLPINRHVETHPINSEFVRDFLASWYFESFNKPAAATAVQDAIATFAGLVKIKGPFKSVNLRVARHESSIFVDLTDADWRQVRIDGSGVQVVDNCDSPIRFRRSHQAAELKVGEVSNPDVLRRFLNIRDEDYILVLAWLVQSLRPEGPYPILIVTGEQGSAKSTFTRVLRRLVDPNAVPLRGVPRNDRDLAIAAQNNWVLCFDNISRIKPELSDALCRIATGSGFATRKLYKDDEESVLSSCRPVILNGIGDLSNRSDLLDRAVMLGLKSIPEAERRMESDFWADFDESWGGIVRFLIELAGSTLSLQRNYSPNTGKPRMADFADVGSAVERVLGLPANTFERAYVANRSGVHNTVIEDSPLANLLLRYVEDQKNGGGTFAKAMLNRELFHELKDMERRMMLHRREPSQLPQTDKAFRESLKRLQPNLRHFGLEIEFFGRLGINRNRGASLQIRYVPTDSPNSDRKHSEESGDDRRDVVVDVSPIRHCSVTLEPGNAQSLEPALEERDTKARYGSDCCDGQGEMTRIPKNGTN